MYNHTRYYYRLYVMSANVLRLYTVEIFKNCDLLLLPYHCKINVNINRLTFLRTGVVCIINVLNQLTYVCEFIFFVRNSFHHDPHNLCKMCKFVDVCDHIKQLNQNENQ